MKSVTITLNEYKSLYSDEKCSNIKDINYDKDGNVGVNLSVFEDITNFIDDNKEITSYLRIVTENKELRLKAQQYVGVIETKQGVVIEILPKISDYEFKYIGDKFSDSEKTRVESEKAEENNNKIRQTFLKMLKALRKSPFKNSGLTKLHNHKNTLLEIFITMFCDELDSLVKKGLKSDYLTQEENSPFLKGKLLIKEQLKYNYIHKERFFIAYDEYLMNRIENRLIKSTLKFLYNQTTSNKTKIRIRTFLFIFEEISESKNIDNDFTKVKNNRQMKEYEMIMPWCRIFLRQESFTSFKGSTIAFALLFDMNKVFEDYVGSVMRRHLQEGFALKKQASNEYLTSHNGNNWFNLKPDFLIQKDKENIVVLDTKWKLLDKSNTKSKYDISESDFYQLFAYSETYLNPQTETEEFLILIYPYHGQFTSSLPVFTFKNSEIGKNLWVVPFCLESEMFYLSDDKETKKYFEKVFKNKVLYKS